MCNNLHYEYHVIWIVEMIMVRASIELVINFGWLTGL